VNRGWELEAIVADNENGWADTSNHVMRPVSWHPLGEKNSS
jgi:hypothetical protein